MAFTAEKSHTCALCLCLIEFESYEFVVLL